MQEKLKELLKFLDDNLDQGRENEIIQLFKNSLNCLPVERLPLLVSFPLPEDAKFQPFEHKLIFDNPEIMLYNELVHAWGLSIAYRDKIGHDLPCTVRANFGTVIIASMYGAKIEQRDNNPPWVLHEKADQFDYQKIRDIDPLDFSQGWCKRVIERYKVFNDILSDYKNLSNIIKLVLPDLQGPMDAAEQIRGSEFFLELYTCPDDPASLLEKVSLSIRGFAEHLQPYLTNTEQGFSYQHGTMIKGKILIRNDSSIMVSPGMYKTSIRGFDEAILEHLSGGIHSCGNINHLLHSYINCKGMNCLDFGQSELNDIDKAYRLFSAKKIPLLRVKVGISELISNNIAQKYSTGVTLLFESGSIQEASNVVKKYLES